TARLRRVAIGTSSGSGMPNLLLEQADLPDEVELRAEPGRLVVSAVSRPRAGWASKARAMHRQGEDLLLEPATPTRFEASAWQWWWRAATSIWFGSTRRSAAIDRRHGHA